MKVKSFCAVVFETWISSWMVFVLFVGLGAFLFYWLFSSGFPPHMGVCLGIVEWASLSVFMSVRRAVSHVTMLWIAFYFTVISIVTYSVALVELAKTL